MRGTPQLELDFDGTAKTTGYRSTPGADERWSHNLQSWRQQFAIPPSCPPNTEFRSLYWTIDASGPPITWLFII